MTINAFAWDIEEYNDEDGGGGYNILIQRDEFGEQKIVKVKDSHQQLNTEQVRIIQEKTVTQAKIDLKTLRDKLIWFRN